MGIIEHLPPRSKSERIPLFRIRQSENEIPPTRRALAGSDGETGRSREGAAFPAAFFDAATSFAASKRTNQNPQIVKRIVACGLSAR